MKPYLKPLRVALLSLSGICGAGSSAMPANAAESPNLELVCGLLPTSELQALMGEFSAAHPGITKTRRGTSVACSFTPAQRGSGVYSFSYTVSWHDAKYIETTKTALPQSLKRHGEVQVVSGIGDAAFYDNQGTLHVLRGPDLHLTLMLNGNKDAAARLEQLKPLSAALLQKL